jgi:hypothetical protein
VITIVKVEDGVFKHIHCVELHPFVWRFEGFLVFQFAILVIYFNSRFTFDFVQLLMLLHDKWKVLCLFLLMFL